MVVEVCSDGVFAMCLGLIGPGRSALRVEPGEIAGKPGSVIRVWPLESGGPGNSDAFRFLYRSTGLKGSHPGLGAIFIPSGPRLPAAATSSRGRTQLRAWRRIARHRCIRTERA